MELQITSITSYGKNCIGCKRHKKDIMISFTHEKEAVPNMVHDLFLTTEQAEDLLASLTISLKRNKLEATDQPNKIEPEWIAWSGGDCPLKDDEVEEWQYKINNSAGHINTTRLPSQYDWRHVKGAAIEISGILAYRVTKWKKKPGSTIQESSEPTWELLMYVSARAKKRIEELEAELAGKTLACDSLDASREAAVRQKEEIRDQLSAAQSRLAQLEWRPISVKPTKEDADTTGDIQFFLRFGATVHRSWHTPCISDCTHWRPCAPPEIIDQERAAFEKYVSLISADLSIGNEKDRYSNVETDKMWSLWKAAREAKP